MFYWLNLTILFGEFLDSVIYIGISNCNYRVFFHVSLAVRLLSLLLMKASSNILPEQRLLPTVGHNWRAASLVSEAAGFCSSHEPCRYYRPSRLFYFDTDGQTYWKVLIGKKKIVFRLHRTFSDCMGKNILRTNKIIPVYFIVIKYIFWWTTWCRYPLFVIWY